MHALPPELEIAHYRAENLDLCHASDEDLRLHYVKQGKSEGRKANRLSNRNDFVSLIDPASQVLEIGPFDCPQLTGPNVFYADILGQDDMKQRARMTNRNPETVPFINYVLSSTPLGSINNDFDAVLSSHAIEHQPDLVKHLQDIHRLLKNRSGRYFLLIPDKRYCFDRFISESSIAEIIEAHFTHRKGHGIKSVIEHRALTTHNDPMLHWMTPLDIKKSADPERVRRAIKEWEDANGEYIDVHAWFFTPDSFAQNISVLAELGLINLEVEYLYPTRYGSNEFWVVLRSNRSQS